MKARPKVLLRIRSTVFCAVALMLGQPETVADDTASDPNDPSYHDPSQAYPPGPRALHYDQASAALKADVNEVLQNEDLNQPPSSYQTFASAAAAVNADAKLQTDARAIGLNDAVNQGVVP